MPLVSVIVPTYNRDHMVSQTIDAILSQTLADLELIVVDNESVDNTEEVVKSYQDTRIKYFKNQNNGVVAVNRNFGIRESQGEYISFCDDDDVWMPEKLECQIAEFNRDSSVGMVCSNGIDFDGEREYGNRIKVKLQDSDFSVESLIYAERVISSTAMIKKEVLDNVGIFDESPELFTVEDYELWMRIAHESQISYIGLPLIKYRVHSGGYSPVKDYAKRLQTAEAVYGKLMEKGIIDRDLYQKGIRRLRLHIKMKKLLRYDWMIACVEWTIRSIMPRARIIGKK